MKLKTSKSALKRFKVSGKGKLYHRQPAQNHFNAREDGNSKRNKRTQTFMSKSNMKDVKNLMPYIK